MVIFYMQDTQALLQTQHIFGSRRWHRLPTDQWHALYLPDHLIDQVLRVLIAKTTSVCLIEFQVAEQFPKDAFDYLARSAIRLGFSQATVNVLHCRSPNAHLIFWDKSHGGSFFHLDLDFANLSNFDQHLLMLVRRLTPDNWTEIVRLLNGQSLGKAFFKTLRTQLAKIPCDGTRAYHGLVDLILKLLFLVFVQRKGWLNFDPFYMESKMEACRANGLSILHCFFRPLFARLEGIRVREWITLGALPRLGGGLFHFQPEWLPPIPNEWLLNLYRNLVSHYSFSLFETREDREVVGISPEVLGHVFENLLAGPDRKKLGTYFTPMRVALDQVNLGLDTYLKTSKVALGKPGYRRCLDEIKIFDPSCGSGTYLVAAFQALLRRHLDAAPANERYNGKLYALKRRIVTQNLFGLDIHPVAIRLAEVRLWLNMIQDLEVSEPGKAPPLPSLQHHLRAGDFLGQYQPRQESQIRRWPKYAMLLELRKKFPSAAAKKRLVLLRHIERLEVEMFQFMKAQEDALQWEPARVQLAQTKLPGHPKLKTSEVQRPFRRDANPAQIHIMFSETMLNGGFHMVVGNPPWLSAAKMAKGHRSTILDSLKKPPELVLAGQVDLSLYFFVAAMNVLKPKGHLSFLMPGKLLQAKYAKGLRHYLQHHYRIDFLSDFGIDQRMVFQADTFPLAIGVSHCNAEAGHLISVEIKSKQGHERFSILQSDLTNRWGTWLLEEPNANPLDNVMASWPSLIDLGLKPRRGQVTQAKRFFVFPEPPSFMASDRLRPLLRGRDIQAEKVAPGAWIYWPFADQTLDWDGLAAQERRWLRRCRKVRDLGERFQLPYRSQKQKPWLLIWKYLGKEWQVALCRSDEWVPDQTTYYLELDQFEKAYRLFAYCHWPGVSRFLERHAERGKDRFFFFYAHTVELLPVPAGLDQLPLPLPQPRNHLPCEGKALWKGVKGKARLKTWNQLISKATSGGKDNPAWHSLFEQAG